MANSLLRRALRRIRTAFAVALITVLLLEAVLWIFLPARGPESREHLTQALPGLKSEVTYERNQFGVRSLTMRTRKKPPRTIRLLTVGASTTDQSTQDTADTWSGLLERRLGAEFAARDVHVEVGAYGRGGETVYDTLAWARENVVDLDADAVVTLVGINDLAWHGGPDYRYDPARRDRRLYEGAAHFCRRWSQICRWSIRVYDQIRIRHALARGEAVEWHTRSLQWMRNHYAELPFSETLARDPDPFDEFSDGADLLFGWLEEHHVPSLVLAQPVLWRAEMGPAERALLWFSTATPGGHVRPGTRWLFAEMQRYNSRQRDLAVRHHARFLDAQIAPTVDNFFDDCHFTDRGNRAMADAIYPAARALVEEAAARHGY